MQLVTCCDAKEIGTRQQSLTAPSGPPGTEPSTRPARNQQGTAPCTHGHSNAICDILHIKRWQAPAASRP